MACSPLTRGLEVSARQDAVDGRLGAGRACVGRGARRRVLAGDVFLVAGLAVITAWAMSLSCPASCRRASLDDTPLNKLSHGCVLS